MAEDKDLNLPLVVKPIDELLTGLLVEYLNLGGEFQFFDLSPYTNATKGIKADYDKREVELVGTYTDILEQYKEQWMRQAQGETITYLIYEKSGLLADNVSLKDVLNALRAFHKSKGAVKLQVHIPVTYNDQPQVVAVRVK